MLIDTSDVEMFKENKYDGSVYYVLAGKHELSISVRVNAFKVEGIYAIARKEYLSTIKQEIFI